MLQFGHVSTPFESNDGLDKEVNEFAVSARHR